MFHTVNLEMSLKPFYQTDEASIREVCRQVFAQWNPLLKGRKVISIMLWTADGSEILDYDGNMDTPFAWCCYLGTANRELLKPEECRDISLHDKKQYYRADPPEMTYGILKRIVTILKEEGKRAFPSAKIRVGETFDIGPEFAESDFKYRRHQEVCSGSTLDSFGFVDATALLHGDSRAYAAYPNGIPEGTPFATFFGKQSNVFLKDMGFDYLWLSNGLGFSANPWEQTGKIYDGKKFHGERLAATKKQVFDFWRLFRAECPELPIEVRGTNNSVGIDYATDGVPLYDIYQGGFGITPPPNSPWAALNGDFGIELMGHMTRICNLPGDDFMFRFYIHDPWWANTPWHDRYNDSPHDIYLPMAVSRIDETGRVRSAEMLNLLSIDNSFGGMPDDCVNETVPHLLKAEKDVADAPAPLVWVYPMREYTTSESEEVLREMYLGDNYIRSAISAGLPLNCVVSTDNFLKTDLSVYRKSILISPVPENEAVVDKLAWMAAQGQPVIYYGTKIRGERLPGLVDSQGSPDAIREKLAQYGYDIRFSYAPGGEKAPVMTVAAKDHGLLLTAYNTCMATDTHLRFPLGAPILTGTDAQIREGRSVYRFSKCDHKECRVFVEQAGGVVTLKALHPNSSLFRRKLLIAGLSDATVWVLPEDSSGLQAWFATTTAKPSVTPVYDESWQRVEHPVYGTCYRAEHVTGSRLILFPFPEK